MIDDSSRPTWSNPIQLQIALQYTVNDAEDVRCYANNAYNRLGTHLAGFRRAITRALNAYGKKENLFRNGTAPLGEDFRTGLTAIVSVHVPAPQFESQSKIRLNNPEVEGIVASEVQKEFTEFLRTNPEEARRIIKKSVSAAQARESKKRRGR
jgi:DNA gyrase subunit B